MPRDPSTGIYTPIDNSWNPAVAGTVIDPDDWNDMLADFTEAFNSSITPGANYIVQDAAGTIDVADDTRGYRVTSGVNGALTFNLGSSANRGPFTVALDGADPNTYAITVAFAGSQTCRGASSFTFSAPYEVVTFNPRDDGTGWWIG